jgi:transcriptional regulator with GAF, ATPase, and Fis domain
MTQPLRVFTADESEAQRIAITDAATGGSHEMIAASEALRQTLEQVSRIARSKIPVLIHGETGTGKELIARIVHEQSPRRDAPLIQVNFAAFSEMFIERDLF